MSREKGPDEIFCRSCGEPVKKKAEICPNCGVANEYTEPQQHVQQSQRDDPAQANRHRQAPASGESTAPSPEPSDHDPSAYSTTTANRWHYGVGASVALWILGFSMPEGSGTAGLFFLLAWVLMPVSVYYDTEWVRATSKWNPDTKAWIILTVLPLVNIVAGIVYLFRRFNTEQISPPDSTRAGQENDTALERLRERYSRGELTDEEFERKVEKIVGTESESAAELHVGSNQRDDP